MYVSWEVTYHERKNEHRKQTHGQSRHVDKQMTCSYHGTDILLHSSRTQRNAFGLKKMLPFPKLETKSRRKTPGHSKG